MAEAPADLLAEGGPPTPNLAGRRLQQLEAYRARCVTLGRQVQLLSPGRPPIQATALDVGEAAELLVRLEDGSVQAVNAGEVSVRGLYGYVQTP